MIDFQKLIFDIAKVGAQKYVAQPNTIKCEDCDEPATETWTIPIPPYAEHYCERCAERKRSRYYEGPHHALKRAEND